MNCEHHHVRSFHTAPFMGRVTQACRSDRAAPQPRAALQHRADDADRGHSPCGDERQRARPDAWGLVPGWWKKPLKELPATFNARAETVAEKPMFRTAFKTRRCIIPASGFYEWTGKAGTKTPHYFSARSGEPLAFAALWEQAKHPDTGELLASSTIIVGAANNWMNRFHDRQPVILDWRRQRVDARR